MCLSLSRTAGDVPSWLEDDFLCHDDSYDKLLFYLLPLIWCIDLLFHIVLFLSLLPTLQGR